jgi:hypothetical protein
MTDQLLTVKDVAKVLRIRQHGVLNLIRSGELKADNISRSSRPRWRIRPEFLQAFLDQRTYTPAAPRRRRRRQQAAAKEWF